MIYLRTTYETRDPEYPEPVDFKDALNPMDDQHKVSPDQRRYLHQMLDEWIDKSEGTGYVIIGNHRDLVVDYGAGL